MTSSAPTTGDDRGLWTVPNVISVARLCCLPLFLYLLFGRDNRTAAGWLLAGLGATDWVDGYIARRFGQVSEIGKVLDPTADRLLFIVGIVALIVDNSAPRWFAVLVLVREVLIGAAMAVLTLAGMRRFDVTYLGKCAAFALMFAFPAFLLAAAGGSLHDVWQVTGWVFGLPGLVLSYFTGVAYVPMMVDNLRAGRAERTNGGR